MMPRHWWLTKDGDEYAKELHERHYSKNHYADGRDPNAIFRNESPILASELIRQACEVADVLWPGERRYSFVDEKAIQSRNPGYCYLVAGWRRCGHTKNGLLILEHNWKE